MKFSEFISESNDMVGIKGDKLFLKPVWVNKIIKNIERIIVANNDIEEYKSFKICTIYNGSLIVGRVVVKFYNDKIEVVLQDGDDFEDELATCKRDETRVQFYNHLKKTLKECPSYT